VGTDENKLFIKAHVEKAESEDANYGGSVLYSRNVADYWDVQAGVNYERLQREDEKQDRWAGVVGLHGMAPYFLKPMHIFMQVKTAMEVKFRNRKGLTLYPKVNW
jgi:copper resistance protein B